MTFKTAMYLMELKIKDIRLQFAASYNCCSGRIANALVFQLTKMVVTYNIIQHILKTRNHRFLNDVVFLEKQNTE